MPAKCPIRRKETAKKASKKHYEANKQAYIERAAKRKAEMQEKWYAFKSTLSCTYCGFNDHPACLDFHHVITDGHQKVHRLVANGQIEKAFEEIKKCVVLCSNCHRHLHNNVEFEQKVLEKIEGTFKTALRRVAK